MMFVGSIDIAQTPLGWETGQKGIVYCFFDDESIDELHEKHRAAGATIVSPIENKPWGLREYTVRDLNGHYLRFGQGGSDRLATAEREPANTVAIVERLPTVAEYQGLIQAVGWAPGNEETYHEPNEEIEISQLTTFAGRLANLAFEICRMKSS